MKDLDARLDALVMEGSRRRLFTGAALAVRTPTGEFARLSGVHAQDDDKPIDDRSLFDLASVTKTFVACAVSSLVADGLIDPDAPVAEVLPVGTGSHARAITMRMLLTHTAGLPEESWIWRGATLQCPGDRDRAFRVELESTPGTRFRYSCVGYVAAGAVAEAIMGAPIDQLVQERVLGPLGLHDTAFGPVPRQRAVATEDESYLGRGVVRGSVHDELAWYLGGRVGNAGLFAPIGDVLRFAEEFRSPERLGVSVHALMTTPSPMVGADKPGFEQGWGLRIGDRTFMASDQSFGHTGFTGTMWVVDPVRETAAVLLTNRVHPTREGTDLTALRHAFSTIVAESVDGDRGVR